MEEGLRKEDTSSWQYWEKLSEETGVWIVLEEVMEYKTQRMRITFLAWEIASEKA